MENAVNANATQSPERPKFLTVLCILTFIGSGLGLLGDILTLLGINPIPTKEATTIGTTLELLGCLLCLLGAVRMWSLHKDGFWVYVAGIALSVASVGPLIHAALHRRTIANTGFWVGLVWVLLLYITFTILYGANKKYLVK